MAEWGQLALGIGLRDGATFDNYHAGPNAEVVEVLRRGQEPVVFVAGGWGSGKSHLLQAACRAVSEAGEGVAYLPLAEVGVLDPAMLEGLEDAALVCLDDVQAVAGNGAWETGLFHLFNRLREAGHRLVAAGADTPPHLGLTLPDLRSRLAWGPVFQLQPLNDDQKAAALRERFARRGLQLPAEVAAYLLRRFPRDMHSLFDLLERLDHASLVSKRRLTLPFVKTLVEQAPPAERPDTPA